MVSRRAFVKAAAMLAVLGLTAPIHSTSSEAQCSCQCRPAIYRLGCVPLNHGQRIVTYLIIFSDCSFIIVDVLENGECEI
ncbi:MAG: hypothetical protein KatS3mg053_3804 [Candidatus Roseilinea sp.]|nr:MAG: hypothetical protein KatS3mg053_3804 [Candidatus Roseilinea sp.]